MQSLSADVVFAGVDQTFSYRIPQRLSEVVRPGMLVLAPFGRRRCTGTLVETSPHESPQATRDIECVLDPEPAFSPEMLRFTKWIAEYYLCPWGDVLKAALPPGMAADERRYWVLQAEPSDANLAALLSKYPSARPLLEALQKSPLTSEGLRKTTGISARSALVRELARSGVLDYRPILRPPQVKTRYDDIVTLSPRGAEMLVPENLMRLRSVHEQNLLREIAASGAEGVARSALLKSACSARRRAFARLVSANALVLKPEPVSRWDPRTEPAPASVAPQRLTVHQQQAVQAVCSALDTQRGEIFLLFGVTGSGKTEVYLEAIRHALAQGKTALVLLPEIALTPFVWGRFFRAFGDRVAIQHSGQSPAVRYDLWREIRAGRYPVVVGARSAVFAPLSRLGLIVVDEEQESSYKQEEPEPRYHARDAALMRARMANAVALLGSATPSVESFHHAYGGRYRLLTLPERVGGAKLPTVRVIAHPQRVPAPDEKEVPASQERKRPLSEPPFFSPELVAEIRAALEHGRQVILLQNRRGFAPFLLCAHCAAVPVCPNCSVSLTYHRRGQVLRCHYCDHREPYPGVCARCGGGEWLAQGLGTQRLEEAAAALFPEARILRLDSDTATRRGTHGRMVTAFAAHEYDLLVGTQMVAKGLDFPAVVLSAIVRADTELFYPDFRASERAAALMMQVAGRAGRRAETGTVVLQTAVPDHPVLKLVMSGDWEQVVQRELESRRQAAFPPFARLVLVRARAKDESSCARALLKLKRILQRENVEVLGPAPALVSRIRGYHRYHVLVRTRREGDPSGSTLRNAVRTALELLHKLHEDKGVALEVDVDPQAVA